MAYAQSNDAYLEQNGTNNTALIEQDFSGAGASNTAGTRRTPVLQQGAENVLRIEQSGQNNSVGSSEFTQRSPRDGIFRGVGNRALVRQTTVGNEIETITQTRNDDGTANRLRVRQGRANGLSGSNNTISEIDQNGNSNRMRLRQTGENNYTDLARQSGSDNSARLVIRGDNNGASDNILDGSFAGAASTLGNNADFNRRKGGRISQIGTGNQLDLLISRSGERNQYVIQNGARRGSVGNMATGLIISGDDNGLGIYQGGSNNDIALAEIMGDDNSVGIVQVVDNNFADVLVESSSNDLLIWQNGSNNNVVARIGGRGGFGTGQTTGTDENTATLTMDGDDNYLNVQQRWGGDNTMDVTINGDFNNNSGSFSGAASTLVFGVAQGATGLTMSEGSIWQHGSGNTIDITVGGLRDSDGNLFAMLQRGDDNTIIGTIDGAGSNEAVVYQVGSSNLTNFSQNGFGNVMGVLQ